MVAGRGTDSEDDSGTAGEIRKGVILIIKGTRYRLYYSRICKSGKGTGSSLSHVTSPAGIATALYSVSWIVGNAYSYAGDGGRNDRSQSGRYSWFKSSNDRKSFTTNTFYDSPLAVPYGSCSGFDFPEPHPHLAWVNNQSIKKGIKAKGGR
jgi:hypothetical protein